MIPSSWTPEFGETADILNSSRAMLEPILEETSEEEENHELWSQYESVWSSESDTGSVIRVDLTQEPDCTSEREYACPPKRRKHEFDIFEDNLRGQELLTIRKSKFDSIHPKFDGSDLFGRRYDLRLNKPEDSNTNELYSDSDSLSFASLSRSSSLIQFESLEKQLLSDNNSYGSSPSIYSQVSLDSMENKQNENKKNVNYNFDDSKQTLSVGAYQQTAIKLNLINGFRNSNNTTDASQIINNAFQSNNLQINEDILLSEKPIIRNENNFKSSLQKSKNSIESLSEDSGYSENFSNFLRTKSKSIPCFKKQNKNNYKKTIENEFRNRCNDYDDDDFYDDDTFNVSKSLEHFSFNHHDDHEIEDEIATTTQKNNCLYLDLQMRSSSSSSNKFIKQKNNIYNTMMTTTTPNVASKIRPSNKNNIIQQTNRNDSKNNNNFHKNNTNKQNILPSRSSPILHEEIGLIFNGSYPENLVNRSNNLSSTNNRINKKRDKYLYNNEKDFSVVSSVPENLNICGSFEEFNSSRNINNNNYNQNNNTSDCDEENEIYTDEEEKEVDIEEQGKLEEEDEDLKHFNQLNGFNGWNSNRNTFLSAKSYNSYSFESGCSFKPALTMSYANLTLLTDEDDDDNIRINKNCFRNNFDKPKQKETNILYEFSANFDRELSILNDQHINYDPAVKLLQNEKPSKTPPQPPPRKFFSKSDNTLSTVNASASAISSTNTSTESLNKYRRTFDQDPTNLTTSYTESLERCNFDLGTPVRINSTEYLSKPLSPFNNTFVYSTPNLNHFSNENHNMPSKNRDDIQFKSMRQISNPDKPIGIIVNSASTSNSKGNLLKGVSFCPIVSEISWKENIPDIHRLSDDSLNDDNFQDDTDDEYYEQNNYPYKYIDDEDDFSYFNPPSTKMFTIPVVTNTTTIPPQNLSTFVTPKVLQSSTTSTSTFDSIQPQLYLKNNSSNTTALTTIENNNKNNNKNNNQNNKSKTAENVSKQEITAITTATIKKQPPLSTIISNSKFYVNSNDHGISDRDLNLNTTQKTYEINKRDGMNINNTFKDPTATNTTTAQFHQKKKRNELSNENFSCSLSMNTVESKPLVTLKNNINNNLQNNSQVKNINSNKNIIMETTTTSSNFNTTNKVVDDKIKQKSNKKSKNGSFLSRLSSFRFSLKNKSKKNKNKNDNNLSVTPNTVLDNKNLENNKESVQVHKNNNKNDNNSGVLINNNKVNNLMCKPQDFVHIPLKDPSSENKQINNTFIENIAIKEEHNLSSGSSSNHHEMINENHFNNNNHVLLGKPPLPKLPPRVIGVSAKTQRIANSQAHAPRASSVPREINDECYDRSNTKKAYHHNLMNNNQLINNFIINEKLNSSSNQHNISDDHDDKYNNKIGLIETNLDTHETVVTGKTQSLIELIPKKYINEQNFNKKNRMNNDLNELNCNNTIIQPRRPHKSMEFLLDKENQKHILPPENELQKSHESNALSEHQLRVQASLQRLNIPDWFKQYNSTSQKEGYTGNFYRKRNSDAGRWTGLNSKTTSLSSLGSHRSDKSPLLLSPSAHSHHGQTGFSRWSTSHLNSNQTSPSISTRGSFVRGNLNASTMSGNSVVSTTLSNNIRSSFRQPYLGWRSQEKLAQPRTPAERLASSILTKQQHISASSQKQPPETEEIQTSIKEVTSAIVHYVNDQNSRTVTRSRSASPNTRKCWLESSFVGNRPLESPQTPIIDKTIHDSSGNEGNKYNGGATPIPAFTIQPERPSPGSATLEDVLASLLGLPIDSHRSSENLVNEQQHNESSRLQVEQVSIRRHSEGDAKKNNSDSNSSAAVQRRVSLDSCESKQQLDIMKCRYPKCDSSTNAAAAKKLYKSCHNCSNMYCSRECRRAHWEKHRKACLHSRVSSLSRQVLSTCKDDADTLRHLSLIARKGYLSQGRGVVRILFRSPESADTFIKQGFQCIGEAGYVRWADLLPAEMGPELYPELLRLSTEYKPESKMLVYVAICVVSEAPGSGAAPVKWERQLVSRCAKLKLCKSIAKEIVSQNSSLQQEQKPVTDIIILTFPTVKKTNQKIRETISKNIQYILKARGVNLRKHFPEVFQRLTTYVDGTSERFLPVTIHPRDNLTGKSFICIIMPNNNDAGTNIRMPTSDSGNRVHTIDVSLEKIEYST